MQRKGTYVHIITPLDMQILATQYFYPQSIHSLSRPRPTTIVDEQPLPAIYMAARHLRYCHTSGMKRLWNLQHTVYLASERVCHWLVFPNGCLLGVANHYKPNRL